MTLLQTDRQTDTRRESLANRLGEVLKAVHVKTYTRKAGGNLVTVHEHEDSRINSAWGNFPDVIPHSNIVTMKRHPQYAAAKAGDADAAHDVIRSVVNRAKADALAKKHPKAIIVAVHAEEMSGRNKLPLALAHYFEDEHGLEADSEIVQDNKAKHTGATAAERILRVPTFSGPVQSGREYIICDDVATSGSTLAGLRHHIESNGGKVVAATVLGAGFSPQTGSGTHLAIKSETLKKLHKKFDKTLLNELIIHHGIAPSTEHLTNSQGKYIGTFGTLDAFRNRISPAGQAGSTGENARQIKASEGLTCDHSIDPAELLQAIRRERLARRIDEIVKCANSDTTPFTPAQTKAKNAQARQLSEAIYEAAAIAAAHKIEADKKEKRKKEIAAILLLLLLAGEDAYLKIYSTLGTDGLKNADETQISEQAKTFAASRQEDLREFAGKLRDSITEAKAEAFGMPEADAARHVREAAVKTSQVMIDVETTCTLGSIELDRLKRAGFTTCFWSQLDRPTKRHSHAENQNEGVVKIGHKFSNGQRFPGDPCMGVGEVINCACQLVPVGRE
jgi:hypothetical protein